MSAAQQVKPHLILEPIHACHYCSTPHLDARLFCDPTCMKFWVEQYNLDHAKQEESK